MSHVHVYTIHYRGWTIQRSTSKHKNVLDPYHNFHVIDPDGVRVLMRYSTLEAAKAEVDHAIAREIEKAHRAQWTKYNEARAAGQMEMF